MPEMVKWGVIGSGCIDISQQRLSAYRTEIERSGRAGFEVQLSGNAGGVARPRLAPARTGRAITIERKVR